MAPISSRMKLAGGTVEKRSFGTLGCAVLLIVYDLILVVTPWDINSMSTQRPEHSNGRRERRRKGPSTYWFARLGPQLKNRSLAMPFLAGFDFWAICSRGSKAGCEIGVRFVVRLSRLNESVELRRMERKV